MNTNLPDISRTLIIVLIIMLLLRFFPALWGGLLLVAMLAGLIALYKLSNGKHKSPQTKEKDQLALAISQKVEECKNKASGFRQEAEEIRKQHQELAQQMERAGSADPLAQQKAEKLLERFDNEMSLRLAKAAFFDASLEQLNQMLENRRLQQQLDKSEKALERWQDANFEDVADLESMRERIRLDKAQLETISELAQRAAISPSLQHAVALKKQLEEIPR